MIASIEEPIPALVARDFLVELTSADELELAKSAIPLIIVSFQGLDPQGDVATWSVVVDHDLARDLSGILAGVIRGSVPSVSRALSRRRRRSVRPPNGSRRHRQMRINRLPQRFLKSMLSPAISRC